MTKEQFEQQVIPLIDMMYRVSCSILKRPQDRNDAVQSSLLSAWQHKNRLRDENAFKAWLIRILINECYKLLRQNRHLIYVEAPDTPRQMPDHTLRDAILNLPEKLKMPVVLHYIEGIAVNEAAQMLGIPPGTVKTRLRKARQVIRDAIGEEA